MKESFAYLLLSILFLFTACTDEESSINNFANNEITVLFSPNGLGDMGYNDCILRGLQQVRKEQEHINSKLYSPTDIEEAKSIFSQWLSMETDEKPSLFVLACSDYENMATELLKDKELPENKSILLFESSNPSQLPIYHFQISMYGASYLAGITAAKITAEPPLVILGNFKDEPTHYAANGFEDGYISQTNVKSVTTHTLANDWSGYAKASETYQLMNEWAQSYGFIYSVAGGSNSGIYRYLREYPTNIYTAGMDTDQSGLCSQIVGSMVKHIDILIETYINQWIKTGTMPQKTIYGLESGYVDWILSPQYKETFQNFINAERDTAILKEKEYDKNI